MEAINQEKPTNLIDFLCERDAIVSYADKWMVVEIGFVEDVGERPWFTVYQRRNRKTVTIFRDHDEEEAIAAMLVGEI